MFESNKPSSTGSGSMTDELGSLLELALSFGELKQSYLQTAHIVRVWLKMPELAIYFYTESLKLGLTELLNSGS